MIDIFKAASEATDTAIRGIASKLSGKLKTLSDSKAKVYRTFTAMTGTDTPCELLTTSKDVHLAMGRLSKLDHEALARTILSTFDEAGEKTGLLSIPGDRSSVLVSLTSSEGIITIHLSPAH